MSDPFADRPFPRSALIGATVLLGFTLLTAALGRVSGFGTTQFLDVPAVEVRELRFEDRNDGGVAVYDAGNEHLVEVLAPGTNGFARGALRGLARERKRLAIGAEAPFRLVRWSDGRLSLEDPETGRRIDLGAFGPTNAGVFARLVHASNAQ